MSYLLTALSILCGAIVLGSISIRRAGWLDRVVAYHKNKFFDELRSLPPIQIKATIEPAPPGYQDSQDWDFESVERLLILIRDSEGAKDVRMALRRSLGITRRFMSMAQSFKAFSSLMKDHDDFYETDSGEYYADVSNSTGICSDKDIIVVSNPVEARLPSARISVGLLKSILENRANAARYMPTTKKIIPWSSVSKHTVRTTRTTKADETSAASASPEHSLSTLPSTEPPKQNNTNANTTQSNTTQSNTTQSNTTQSNTTQSNTTQSNTTQSNTTQSNTTQSNTTQSNTTQSNTTQSNTTQSNTTQSNTTQSNSTQSNTTNVNCTNPKNVTCNCTTKSNVTSNNCNCTKHNCTKVNCTNTNCTNANNTISAG